MVQVVADVTVANAGEKPVAYIGFSCSNPAAVQYRSTRPDPTGPSYSPSAEALRASVMEYRRSLDALVAFSEDPAGPSTSNPPCDDHAPPELRPHQTLADRQISDLAITGRQYVDSLTTDIVTTLKLGNVPAPGSTAPIQPTGTIEVRIPLRELSSSTLPSRADLGDSARQFDIAMTNPDLSRWVDAQDPSSWGDVRLESGSSVSRWTLTAFDRGWSTPLTAKGLGARLTDIRVPTERLARPAETAATLPPGSYSNDASWISSRDLYVGDLVLPSGRVMVGDPVTSTGMLTFDLGLPPGRYPVHVVTARPRYLSDDWALPAWEALMLSNAPVTQWVPAVPIGHSLHELKAGDLFSWSSDGSTGGFASPEAMQPMDSDLLKGHSLYTALGDREEANRWLWAFLTVDPLTNANVFASRADNGGGAVLLGLDARSQPAVLLSDFTILNMYFDGYRTY
jgi:hypothetical protein